MLMKLSHGLILAAASAFLVACSNSGNLTLEPGARKINTKGSPYAQVNQGGKSLVIEQGKTASTGVHGWVAVQSVVSKSITDGGSHQMIMNKTSAFR
jgi:hypothetical protein